MRYLFIAQERDRLTFFLIVAVEQLNTMTHDTMRLKSTSEPVESQLMIKRLSRYLNTLKGQAAFWGLMEMLLLIRQTQSLLEVMHMGYRQIEDDIDVAVLLDSKNMVAEMICELTAVREMLRGAKEVEFEFSCAQEAECLSAFIQQLIEEKRCRPLVVVPKAVVRYLPAIIPTTALVRIASRVIPSTVTEQVMELCHQTDCIENESMIVEPSCHGSSTVTDETIEQLLTIIRELANTQNTVSQLSHTLISDYHLLDLSRAAKDAGQLMKQYTVELEEKILSMQRVELNVLFLPLQQSITELGLQLGKELYLTIVGVTLTIDKMMVKPLYKLLLTILSAMLKFSIENPTEREGLGKEMQGHMCLTACLVGGKMIITVEDDGQGMKGSDADTEISEISDFMAVVNELYPRIDVLQGQLTITNPVGRGCKVMLTVPSLTTRFSGLVVAVSGEFFIIPTDTIVEIVKVTTKQLVHTRGRQILYHRDRIVGIVSLAEIAGLTPQHFNDIIPIVIVTNGQVNLGIIVHQLYKKQEIILKKLPEYLQNSDYIGGAGITSEGKVALVLNSSALIDKVSANQCRHSI